MRDERMPGMMLARLAAAVRTARKGRPASSSWTARRSISSAAGRSIAGLKSCTTISGGTCRATTWCRVNGDCRHTAEALQPRRRRGGPCAHEVGDIASTLRGDIQSREISKSLLRRRDAALMRAPERLDRRTFRLSRLLGGVRASARAGEGQPCRSCEESAPRSANGVAAGARHCARTSVFDSSST